jgi:hypothetical protein
MARMKHPKGDLELKIDGIDYKGGTVCINGKMGVWSAQIQFEPVDVVSMLGYMFKWQTVVYGFMLPFRMLKKK